MRGESATGSRGRTRLCGRRWIEGSEFLTRWTSSTSPTVDFAPGAHLVSLPCNLLFHMQQKVAGLGSWPLSSSGRNRWLSMNPCGSGRQFAPPAERTDVRCYGSWSERAPKGRGGFPTTRVRSIFHAKPQLSGTIMKSETILPTTLPRRDFLRTVLTATGASLLPLPTRGSKQPKPPKQPPPLPGSRSAASRARSTNMTTAPRSTRLPRPASSIAGS